MTEWLERSVQYFAGRQDVQLVVRIHPGERYLKGPSVAQVVHNALPVIPEQIHLIEASDPINTYDLVEIADMGLAYTTTVGMEMAMSSVPALIGGKTHYRSKGFTWIRTAGITITNCWEAYWLTPGNTGSAAPRSSKPGTTPTVSFLIIPARSPGIC